MRLQIPVGFVVGLPDAAEIGLAADARDARRRGRRLTRGRRDGRGDEAPTAAAAIATIIIEGKDRPRMMISSCLNCSL
jgi:hypothetical protein